MNLGISGFWCSASCHTNRGEPLGPPCVISIHPPHPRAVPPDLELPHARQHNALPSGGAGMSEPRVPLQHGTPGLFIIFNVFGTNGLISMRIAHYYMQ